MFEDTIDIMVSKCILSKLIISLIEPIYNNLLKTRDVYLKTITERIQNAKSSELVWLKKSKSLIMRKIY